MRSRGVEYGLVLLVGLLCWYIGAGVLQPRGVGASPVYWGGMALIGGVWQPVKINDPTSIWEVKARTDHHFTPEIVPWSVRTTQVLRVVPSGSQAAINQNVPFEPDRRTRAALIEGLNQAGQPFWGELADQRSVVRERVLWFGVVAHSIPPVAIAVCAGVVLRRRLRRTSRVSPSPHVV